MPDPSQPHSVTAVARLRTDAATAVRVQDALAEACDGDVVAVSTAQEAEDHWSVALHFRVAPDEQAVRALVASAAGERLAAALVFDTLPPTDWVRKSLEGLTPVDAGRFTVHGEHDRDRIGNSRIAVRIEATLAFGTGHHASTRGCLLALDRIIKQRTRRKPGARSPPESPAVLDIGTGSGVLAIAAARALHVPVLGSDIDRRAVAVAREHARVNGVAAEVEIVHAAGVGARRFRERSPYALVLANILLDPLRQLATPIRRLTARNGVVVLSGLLNAQARSAIASYCARGFVLEQRIVLGGWTTLILTRPSHARARSRPWRNHLWV
jgi:ribosomal protein L11 methyltransferase